MVMRAPVMVVESTITPSPQDLKSTKACCFSVIEQIEMRHRGNCTPSIYVFQFDILVSSRLMRHETVTTNPFLARLYGCAIVNMTMFTRKIRKMQGTS